MQLSPQKGSGDCFILRCRKNKATNKKIKNKNIHNVLELKTGEFLTWPILQIDQLRRKKLELPWENTTYETPNQTLDMIPETKASVLPGPVSMHLFTIYFTIIQSEIKNISKNNTSTEAFSINLPEFISASSIAIALLRGRRWFWGILKTELHKFISKWKERIFIFG